MLHLPLSLAALASAILRTLVLAWILRSNARFVRRHWSTVGDSVHVRTHIFVLCNLVYLSSWLLHSVTLLIEVLVETLLARPSPPVSRIILCEVLGGACVIGAAFHITLCAVRVCDPAIRCILGKWEQEQRDSIHRKLTLILVVCFVPLVAVLIGRFHGSFTDYRGEWHYAEVVRGLGSSANLTYGVELVVCAAKENSEANLFSVAGELGIILGLTGICLIFRLFYEAFHHQRSGTTEDDNGGWRHVSSQQALYSCRWIVSSLPVITTLWLLFLHPFLIWMNVGDPRKFYPEVGIHLLLMLSAILVATSHDAFKKQAEENDAV